MLVKLPKKCIEKKFSELLSGDLILVGIAVVMKIAEVTRSPHTFNCVDMSTGVLESISADTLIKVVHGELTVSYHTSVD